MTQVLDIEKLSERLKTQSCKEVTPVDGYLEVRPEDLIDVAGYLKNNEDLEFNYLDMITAVDYPNHFELVYRLLSLKNNTLVSFKVRCPRDNAVVPSLANMWQGARLQEREIFDLFGIEFTGHPDMRRIVLWEGYEGHPLRKDFKDKAYGAGN
jgi:NADH/F420H2 dehydrogenase subunit C